MMQVRQADPGRRRRWEDEFPARLDACWGPIGAGATVEPRVAGWRRATERELSLLIADGVEVGHVTLARYLGEGFGLFDQAAVFFDLWVDPAHRGRGYGRAARAYGEAWGRERGTTAIAAAIWTADPGLASLFATYPLRNQRMYKALGDKALGSSAGPVSDTPTWSYRAMQAGAEFDQWLERDVASYTEELLTSGSATAGQAKVEAEQAYTGYLPDGLATPDNTIWVIEADGRAVADIWLKHRMAPDLSYVLGVEVRPESRGQGYGRAAMLVGEELTRAAGDSFLGLNVFGHNATALRLYTSLGYQFVDSTRSINL